MNLFGGNNKPANPGTSNIFGNQAQTKPADPVSQTGNTGGGSLNLFSNNNKEDMFKKPNQSMAPVLGNNTNKTNNLLSFDNKPADNKPNVFSLNTTTQNKPVTDNKTSALLNPSANQNDKKPEGNLLQTQQTGGLLGLGTQTNTNQAKPGLNLGQPTQNQPSQSQPLQGQQNPVPTPEQPDTSRKAEDYSSTWREKTSSNVKEMIEIGKVLNSNELKIQENNKVVS